MSLAEDMAQYLLAYAPFLLIIAGFSHPPPSRDAALVMAMFASLIASLNIYIYSRAHGRETAPIFWIYPLVLSITGLLYLVAPGQLPRGAEPVLELVLLAAIAAAASPIPLPSWSQERTILYYIALVAALGYAGVLLAHYGVLTPALFVITTPLLEHSLVTGRGAGERLLYALAHLSFLLMMPSYAGLILALGAPLALYVAGLLYLRAVAGPGTRGNLLALDLVARGLLVLLLVQGTAMGGAMTL